MRFLPTSIRSPRSLRVRARRLGALRLALVALGPAELPRRPAALLGAARAAAAAGRPGVARCHYRTLLDAWRVADPDIPALAEARAYLGGRS